MKQLKYSLARGAMVHLPREGIGGALLKNFSALKLAFDSPKGPPVVHRRGRLTIDLVNLAIACLEARAGKR